MKFMSRCCIDLIRLHIKYWACRPESVWMIYVMRVSVLQNLQPIADPVREAFLWFSSYRPFVSKGRKLHFFEWAIFDQFWSSTAPTPTLCILAVSRFFGARLLWRHWVDGSFPNASRPPIGIGWNNASRMLLVAGICDHKAVWRNFRMRLRNEFNVSGVMCHGLRCCLSQESAHRFIQSHFRRYRMYSTRTLILIDHE